MNQPIVALVTGSGRGIGRAAAVSLAEIGAAVVLTARTASEIADTQAAVHAAGGNALAVTADLTDYAQAAALVDECVSKLGVPHVVVNNAGGDASSLVVRSDPDEWFAVIEQNLRSTYNVTRAVLPSMIESAQGGRIINIGSGTGYSGVRGTSAYASAKAAVAMFTRVLAEEVWKHGIDVNEIVPGPVATRLTENLFGEGDVPRGAPSEIVKTPEDVARLITWLATQPPGGPTGQMFSLARRPLL